MSKIITNEERARKLTESAHKLMFKAANQPNDEFYWRSRRLLEGRANSMLRRAKKLLNVV